MGIGPQPPQPPVRLQEKTIIVSEADVETPPTLGIFQPYYRLPHDEFRTLQSPSRFWNGLGGVLCTFSAAYALPKVIARIQSPAANIEATDWWIIGIILALGLGCFAVSWIFSSERRAVVKQIKRYFKDHPGQPAYRSGRR